MEISAVDLFCGAGGLSLGLKDTGIKILAGIDNDPSCRFPYETNIGAPFIEQDVQTLTIDALAQFFPAGSKRVLVACAPCQPFSGLTTKNRAEDTRWKLLLEVQRLTLGLRPDVLSLENVPRLARLPLWRSFVEALEGAGYYVNWAIKDASHYSVPQRRTRLVLLASLQSEIGLPRPTSAMPKTVRETISKLPPLAAGQSFAKDALHRSRNLTEANLNRIRKSRQSGTWRDWPAELRAACHTRATGKTFPSVYGRMSWDSPAPTITTQFYGFGNGRFGHPEQDRALTLREGATLQSFPLDFQFIPEGRKVSFKEIGRLIGNAVPPKLAEAIGHHIVNHLREAR